MAIGEVAARAGMSAPRIRCYEVGSRDELAHERLRELALLRLPELDDLIDRASSVRRASPRFSCPMSGRGTSRSTPSTTNADLPRVGAR